MRLGIVFPLGTNPRPKTSRRSIKYLTNVLKRFDMFNVVQLSNFSEHISKDGFVCIIHVLFRNRMVESRDVNSVAQR